MNSPDSNPSAATGVDRDHALHLLRAMIRIRRLEEKCAELYSAMKIRGFLHLYDGEEAVAVGVLQALKPDDAVVATYREHAHALTRGISAGAILGARGDGARGDGRPGGRSSVIQIRNDKKNINLHRTSLCRSTSYRNNQQLHAPATRLDG
ncbi:thiamine pyrophosphate-dependent enzyme [Desulfatitalea alkaliphila]|uniref:Thiamine pyrophosphate-dependent enzyme n=1 Tax=Desulfatitalea alkaliphila TaxID=2929485 RepID=A0AA41R501_9BACT|nr:thiamine pyrophosphate-dependent enzyme [Desulfatitalea alkaliphila]MCJ8501130.1 thiamine pyrophosphate-dependent enzyme [Desulfatitalea alkaliphila]